VKQSTTANPDDHLQCLVLDTIPLLLAVIAADGEKSLSEGEEVCGSNCRATEDPKDDSDSTTSTSTMSTSDELVSNMQNLRLQVESAEQHTEALVSRGPPDETSRCWNNDYRSSTQYAWPTLVEPDETALNDVGCKRKKIIYKSPVTCSLQPEPVTAAVTSFESFQPITDCEGWTGWGTQQQDQQATKFRRTSGDPQESDERTRVSFDSSLTSALSPGIGGRVDDNSYRGQFGLSFEVDRERDFAEYCPEIEPELLAWLNDNDSALPQSDALGIKTPISRGSLLDQLKEIGPPLVNWSAEPNPEITSQRNHGDDSHVAMSMPGLTAPVIDGDITTHTSTHLTSLAAIDVAFAAAANPPDRCVSLSTEAFPLSDFCPPPGSSSALSPSADSGCVASPISLTDDFSFTVNQQQDLPPDIIFEYVETKLRELVRYVFVRFLHHVYVLTGVLRGK